MSGCCCGGIDQVVVIAPRGQAAVDQSRYAHGRESQSRGGVDRMFTARIPIMSSLLMSCDGVYVLYCAWVR